MRLYVREGPRTIALVSATHSLTFSDLELRPRDGVALKTAVQMEPNSQTTKDKGFRLLLTREVHGCLGLINVAGQNFLAVITGAVTNVARPLPYESVDKIHAVEFISLSSDEWDYVNLDTSGYPVALNLDPDDADGAVRVVHPCFELKKLLSNGSFYYSNDFDLTSVLQNRGVNKKKLVRAASDASIAEATTSVDLQHYQEQYMWNSFLMEELIKFRNNLEPYAMDVLNKNRFLTTVIRGFASTTNLGTRGDSISLISKQSWKRAGTRFNARGIDDDGNVANFVETEFIYTNVSRGQVFAFTQIRGSVPAFWEQDSTLINPKITVTRSRGATQPSFDKHFTEVCKKYGVCHIVNLLSKTKSQEVEVSRRYTDLLNHSDHKDELRYSHFDFHAETKQLAGGFAGATKILPMLYDSLEMFGWYDFDVELGEVVTRQDGVFRVNCLDCLDRTNLIEQVVCQCILDHILKNQGPGSNASRDNMRREEIISKHNTIWADNGDAISQIYTGTNALKSSFTRSGKMNFAGALSDVTKSVSRMYQNTFVDSKKQSIIDLLLGKDGRLSIPVQIYDPIGDYVTDKLKQIEGSYTTYSNMTMFTGTYNVNAAVPSTIQSLSNWLFPPENASQGCPDVYAIGLQELIELNAGSILAADSSKPSQWAKLLQAELDSQSEKYLLLRTESIASMSLFFFVKKSLVHNVTQVSGSSKKTGLGGITANKGACAVRFDYGSTSFALVTSHLAAGIGATVDRRNDYTAIILGLTFTRNYRITDHDHVVWFGDLNYRIDYPNDVCRNLIENGAFDELAQADQLYSEMLQEGGAFNGFSENKIKFYPTYKYDRGTSNYDTSEKQRVPSWTDRVVYRSTSDSKIESLNYNSVMDIYASDHKPVYSTFSCRVKFVNEEKKKQLTFEYYKAYKAEHGESDGLLDLGRGSESSANSVSSTSTFASDTLSEMNLLDVDHAPPLPTRAKAHTVNTLPRRVPPPPLSRKAVPLDTLSRPNAPNASLSMPLPAETIGPVRAAPPPVPARAKNFANFGFDSPPLTPGNSTTPKAPSPVANGAASITSPTRPMKPSKPQQLLSSKIEVPTPQVPRAASAEPEAKFKPAPPPARASSTTPKTKEPARGMSEWKPLVPQ